MSRTFFGKKTAPAGNLIPAGAVLFSSNQVLRKKNYLFQTPFASSL